MCVPVCVCVCVVYDIITAKALSTCLSGLPYHRSKDMASDTPCCCHRWLTSLIILWCSIIVIFVHLTTTTATVAAADVALLETGVDTYQLVDCPAAMPILKAKIDARPQNIDNAPAYMLGGQTDSVPWSKDKTPEIGGLLGLFANPATRKKVVLAYGNTSYAAGGGSAPPPVTPMTLTSPFSVASVSKMITGAVFLHHHRDLLDSPVLDSCASACGLPQAFIDAFFSGVNSNITFREVLEHTSGLPDFFSDFGAGESVNGVMLNPFMARLFRNDMGPRQYMAPEDLLNFTATKLGAYAKTRGQYHYSNDGYILIGMAVEYLQRQRLSALIAKLFDEYVPCTQDLTCGLRFESDKPAWEAAAAAAATAAAAVGVGVRSPVEIRPNAPDPASAYMLMSGRWFDLSQATGSVPGDDTIGPALFKQAEQSRWATAGVVCSASSLANFMIALAQGNIPNVRATDFNTSGLHTNSPGLLGYAGAGGAGGWFDPRESRGLVVAGVTNIEPNNDGIKGLYTAALNEISACLNLSRTETLPAVMQPSCMQAQQQNGAADGDGQTTTTQPPANDGGGAAETDDSTSSAAVLIGASVGGSLSGLILLAALWYGYRKISSSSSSSSSSSLSAPSFSPPPLPSTTSSARTSALSGSTTGGSATSSGRSATNPSTVPKSESLGSKDVGVHDTKVDIESLKMAAPSAQVVTQEARDSSAIVSTGL